MRALVLSICLALPGVTHADSVVATRTIRAQTILAAGDLVLVRDDAAAGFQSVDALVGLEARVTLYAGRAVSPADVGAAALVDRNDVVTLAYVAGGLRIETEGRALGRAAEGESLRVMNLASRNIVTGIVDRNAVVIVRGGNL